MEEFDELRHGQNSIFTIHPLGFELLQFCFEVFCFRELFFEVVFVFADEHGIILFLQLRLGVGHALFGIPFLCRKRLLLALVFLDLLREHTPHLGDVVLVSGFRGEWVLVEEGIGGVHDLLGADRLALGLAADGIATEIEVVLGAAWELLWRDARGHGVVAMAANDHAAHEVSFDAAARLDDIGQRVALPHPVGLADALKVLDGNSRNKVV